MLLTPLQKLLDEGMQSGLIRGDHIYIEIVICDGKSGNLFPD